MGNVYPITFDDDRIVDSQQISTGPTHLQALERALAELIDIGGNGVAFATEIEKAPFAVNQYGWLLGSAAHAQPPGIGGAPKTQEGLRLLDITNHSQGLLCINNGYLEVYEDGTATPDYESTPSWGTYKNRMDLSTGYWERYQVPAVGVALYTNNFSPVIASFTDVDFQGANFEAGECWDVADPTVITFPEDGIYQVCASSYFSSDVAAGLAYYVRLHFATYDIYIGSGTGLVTDPLGFLKPACSGSFIASVSQGDELTLQVYISTVYVGAMNHDLAIWKLGVV